MSQLQSQIPTGVGAIGGIIGYPSDQLYEEIACIAYEFHWSLEEIINMEHRDRRRWVGEISKIREQME